MSDDMARYASGEPLARTFVRPRWGSFPKPLFCPQGENRQEEIIIAETNRTRPYSYSFRVSEREKKTIESKVKQSGMTKTDYLIQALSDKPVVVVPNASEILLELKRQGNNLNQAVKNGHFGYNTQIALRSAVDELKKLYRKISGTIGGE